MSFDPIAFRQDDAFAKGRLISFINQCAPSAIVKYLEDRLEEGLYGDVSMELHKEVIYLEAEVKRKWIDIPFPYAEHVQVLARKLKTEYGRVKWFHIFSEDGLRTVRIHKDVLRASPVKIVYTHNRGYENMVCVPINSVEFFRADKKGGKWAKWDGKST